MHGLVAGAARSPVNQAAGIMPTLLVLIEVRLAVTFPLRLSKAQALYTGPSPVKSSTHRHSRTVPLRYLSHFQFRS